MHSPANVERYDHRTFGQRAADRVAKSIGSWTFILTQTAIIIAWITLNSVAWFYHWDPRPWIMLNLVFSTQAAYAAPILQLSQNRQADHDRARAENDYEVNQQALALITEIHRNVSS